jgi:hypothetical protein
MAKTERHEKRETEKPKKMTKKLKKKRKNSLRRSAALKEKRKRMANGEMTAIVSSENEMWRENQ